LGRPEQKRGILDHYQTLFLVRHGDHKRQVANLPYLAGRPIGDYVGGGNEF
jgi:hypothetical protein